MIKGVFNRTPFLFDIFGFEIFSNILTFT